MNRKIFLHGGEGTGWSLDHDKLLLQNAITSAGFSLTKFPTFQSIIHNICWYQLGSLSTTFLRLIPKKIVTASSFVDPKTPSPVLSRIIRSNPLWIAPSALQEDTLRAAQCDVLRFPFLIDPLYLTSTAPFDRHQWLAERCGISAKTLEGKILFGSFQRDSLGSDLLKPKWQKGADILVEALDKAPKDKFILLLAGPRRHFILRECKKRGIPFLFLGKETPSDDLSVNTLSTETMQLLYRCCDYYLVTSRSEGGPKAVLEASALGSPVISTMVGCAPDFLPHESVAENEIRLTKIILETFELSEKDRVRRAQFAQKLVAATLSKDLVSTRLHQLYTMVESR